MAANTLSWSLLYLSSHPDTQQKLQAEIDAVVGSSRLPSISERSKMPYTEAVIAETLRLSNVVPLGVPHRMTCDKLFHGYDTLFLFLTAIFQLFEVLPDPESKIKPDFEADNWFFLVPKPFKVIMRARNSSQ
ncbi:Cytochrome P450 2B1 [Orchesella cincta]|uniref:Cytochrome P450 2B1 n=1 Tax=Orchesella cincta TaxID=48709 RepID=A0A1D2N510_ORCCI|nr:Cytochrome P450 2B1 [Orchesella cincta]